MINSLRLMDWEQDAPIIIPSVNRVLGKEIRSMPYLHWWTFMGAYMEIGNSTFPQVVNIRSKKAKGKKPEKREWGSMEWLLRERWRKIIILKQNPDKMQTIAC